jgi:hypothetical protein
MKKFGIVITWPSNSMGRSVKAKIHNRIIDLTTFYLGCEVVRINLIRSYKVHRRIYIYRNMLKNLKILEI